MLRRGTYRGSTYATSGAKRLGLGEKPGQVLRVESWVNTSSISMPRSARSEKCFSKCGVGLFLHTVPFRTKKLHSYKSKTRLKINTDSADSKNFNTDVTSNLYLSDEKHRLLNKHQICPIKLNNTPLAEIAWTFYMLHGNMQATFFL